MKKIISTLSVILIIAVLSCTFISCKGNDATGNTDGDFDFTLVMKDYEKAPNADNSNLTSSKVKDAFNDSSLAVNNKASKMIYEAMVNETNIDHFTYFNYKVGTTTLGDKSGTLLYQRLRKQSTTLKDDRTLKYPINHNFGALEQAFVTSAIIRYINPDESKYYRIEAKNSSMTYDETTKLVSVPNDAWKKGSSWGDPQTGKSSMSLEEARKMAIDFTTQDILDASKTKITEETAKDGSKFFKITTEVDVTVANDSSKGESIKWLENDNGGSNMSYDYCKFTCEIWECGLIKSYSIEEKWQGKIKIYEGAAESKSVIKYSYSLQDLDHSNTESIYQSIISK